MNLCIIWNIDIKTVQKLFEIFNELNSKKWNFGNVLSKLGDLDNKTDNENLILNNDYNFLKQMKDKRNFWCNECFIEFIYSKNWRFKIKFY